MTNVKQMQVQPGDWVSGTTVEDEKIRGFVEAVSWERGSALVRVTESDRKDAIGRIAEGLLSKLELLQVEAWLDERALADLIDIALVTRDEQWFMELTSSLGELRNQTKKSKSPTHKQPISMPHRRIWMD
ncbi:IDEAL domain-containing protein [Paenibacillus eucommiae]|uniref:IDEAL domain-containing protein n=1 Tax=Paenibacillus eucommiae TaxID=1355755 RepID=A0ABS4J186_9BACL|nr:IDEAL domain-containing protein [Paenibacillus eucommiae]MBP1993553.1 hypothetical protein [Paenibacillus eucommiae]